MKDILQYPNPLLTRVTEEVTELEAFKLSVEMMEMYNSLSERKLGLAAPQVGINKNFAIVYGVPMCNLSFKSANQFETERESCFSVDNAQTSHAVERPKYGWATWNDGYTFEVKTEKLNGLKARIFQHELDHIKGKLCNQSY